MRAVAALFALTLTLSLTLHAADAVTTLKAIEMAYDTHATGHPSEARIALLEIEPDIAAISEPALSLAYFNNRAAVELELGLYTDSERHYRRALEFSEQLARQHSTITILSNIATVYTATEQWGKAEQTQRRVIELGEKGHMAPAELLAARGRLGLILARTGRVDEAESLLSQTRAAMPEPQNPQEFEESAAQCNTLGWIYMRQGKLARAADVLQAALRFTEQGLGRGDLANVSILRNLSLIAGKRKDWDQANDLLERAVETVRARAPLHPGLRELLLDYALTLDKLGRKEEARQARKRASLVEGDPTRDWQSQHTVHVGELRKPE